MDMPDKIYAVQMGSGAGTVLVTTSAKQLGEISRKGYAPEDAGNVLPELDIKPWYYHSIYLVDTYLWEVHVYNAKRPLEAHAGHGSSLRAAAIAAIAKIKGD